MDWAYANLSRVIARFYSEKHGDGGMLRGEQVWVSLSGGPGAGKSTFARELVQRLRIAGVKSIVVPMDGYHYYKAELDKFDDPKKAHVSRGAPFTFNVEKFLKDLTDAKEKKEFSFPSFDHSQGDPVENSIVLEKDVMVVVVEGNYLLLEDEPWNKIKDLMDKSIFLSVEEEEAQVRITKRHMAAWDWPKDKAEHRVKTNDLPNLRLVVQRGSKRADLTVKSVPDA
jgi:pantothenate kinase